MSNFNDISFTSFKLDFEVILLNSVDEQFIKQIFDGEKYNIDYINNNGTLFNIYYYPVISKLYVKCVCERFASGCVKCIIRVMNNLNNHSSQRDIELCSEFGKIIHRKILREVHWIERRHAVLFAEEINSTINYLSTFLFYGANYLLNDWVFKEIMSYI
jgi:hypothetical protein